jgi:glycosyltransferase involved in cell wall biosynthesis
MNVRLTQIDGKLPNLALMKLARFHRDRGDSIHFTKQVERDMLEPVYDRVYGSAIFSFSADRVAKFRQEFPGAILGGTHDVTDNRTVEQFLGIEENELYDYSIYPNFDASIGFTQRGCRLKCGFCVVPKKEGKPRSVNTIATIWRGEPYPKHIHLLDNDFFGQPREQWEARLDEIRTGGFKVCLNQGINTRMIDDESAAALASVPYYDDSFKSRRLYTAWDSLGDEERFFRGVDTLERHGIPPRHLLVYMLVGYDKRETWERVLYRFNRMVEREIRPFPMIYGDRFRSLPLGGYNGRIAHKPLWEFQKWAVRRYYELMPFEQFDNNARARTPDAQLELLGAS